jgi:hypothetical protein
MGEASAAGTAMPMPDPVFDAGSDSARNQVQAGALCDRLATIQCAGEAHCCNGVQRDAATCKRALLATCVDELLLDAISARSEVGFDSARAATAFEQFETLASMCDPGIIAFAERLDGMRGMFQGSISPGASCTPSNLLNNTMAGAALVSCNEVATSACLPGQTGLSWSCTPRAAAGGRCFSDVNCQDGLYCPNPELALAGGNCAARKAIGAACAQANECQSWFCISGSCAEPNVQSAYCLP